MLAAYSPASRSSSTNRSASAQRSAPRTPSSSSSRSSSPPSPSSIASSPRAACTRCGPPPSPEAEGSACEPALGRYLFVQAVAAFHRASQHSEETDEAAEFMRKLQWELDKIWRDLVVCGITCLTLFGEGDPATMMVSLHARPQRDSRPVC